MIKLWLFLPFAFVIVLTFSDDSCDDLPNIIARHGYIPETHKVITKDGYILSVFRLTNKGESSVGKPAIILQHGIGGSPNSMLENGDSSIGFYLANRGFDVWIPGARGSRYSRGHVNNVTDDDYWNYSFEELGTMDTKAYVDMIYKIKGEKIMYFGFSLGFMQMMAAFSLDPEFFQKRIRKIVGWGGIVRPDLSANIGMGVLKYINASPILNIIGNRGFSSFNKESCMNGLGTGDSFLYRFGKLFNGEFVPYLNDLKISAGGDTINSKTLVHLGYNIYNRGFYRHPSHTDGKLVKYDLSKVTNVPIGLCVGEHDLLGSPANAKWLEDEFKNNGNFKILGSYKYLGHMTFLVSRYYFQHYTDTYNFLRE